MSTQSITNRALRLSFFILVLSVLPAAARAAVSINEVMYDPPGTNTKQTWLELYNGGDSAVDLSKWSITDGAKGTSGALTKHAFNVPPKNGGIGSASLPAGGYVIIADDAATFEAANPSVSNVIDSVFSISNADLGAQVGLIDAQGNIADTFSFSADTYASNKGNSLQRSGGNLVSALPTPGALNATEAYIPPDDAEEESSSSASKTPSVSSIPPPAPAVFADAGASRTVIVGADTPFRAQAYDRDRAAFKSARFVWNFGDGTSAEGSQVMHHFSYPGRYDVELYITNQNYSASSKTIVEAKETMVAMAMLAGGGVSVQNRAGRDLDLSYWLVRQATTTFKLPEHSVVLAGEAINIDQATLGFAATDAKLLYPNETEVATALALDVSVSPVSTQSAQEDAAAPTETEAGPESDVGIPVSQSAPAASEGISMPAPAPQAASTSATTTLPQEPASTELVASVATSGATLPMWGALAGLGGVMGLGLASVYAVRRRPVTGTMAEEFTIE